MPVKFRNITITPDDPAELWGIEGISTAIDRGGSTEWKKIAAAVNAEPYGRVATQVEQALTVTESPGGTAHLREVLRRARMSDRERTVQRIRRLFTGAEMTQTEYAARIGTSRTRLSTYLSGSVIPSAQLLTRMERVTRNRQLELF